MTRPTDKPMARAQAHLAAGRHSEAIGAFRAVLGIDPSIIAARLGLADALAARGQRDAAVDGLVEAAERCAELEQHEQALVLYGKALAIVPARAGLHLDVAVVEHAMGRTEAAIGRVEGLAERYMSLGRTEEAAELLRFTAAWEEVEEVEEVEAVEEVEPEEATVIARNPLLAPRPAPRPAPTVQTETVVCATVLVRPDGSLWPAHAASPATSDFDEAALTIARAVSTPSAFDEFDDPDMVTRVASSAMALAASRTVGKPTRAPARPIVSQGPMARPIVSQGPMARPVVSRPASEPASEPAPSPLVERLRRRAGLGPEVAAVPQSTQGKPTEPIAIRRPSLGRPEEEVTHRVRHPLGSLHAASR